MISFQDFVHIYKMRLSLPAFGTIRFATFSLIRSVSFGFFADLPSVGDWVEGIFVGAIVTGAEEGDEVNGLALGDSDGPLLGDALGLKLGSFEGLALGDANGLALGEALGCDEGAMYL